MARRRSACLPLAGDAESFARGINRRGDVVGFSIGQARFTAVLWPAR